MIVFKRNNFVRVEFSDGYSYVNSNCSEELADFITSNAENEDVVRKRIDEEDTKDIEGKNLVSADIFAESELLQVRGSYVCMPSVSEISIPADFCKKILEAEKSGNKMEISRWVNFWTLVSLNPDSRVRDNIFWFIRKWNIKISDSGFLIAYRNADIKKESSYTREQLQHIINTYYTEKYANHADVSKIKLFDKPLDSLYYDITEGEEVSVYTDAHSHTTTIKLGHPVSIPRKDCDCDSNVSCSKGLHASSAGWLKRNYFGQVGMQVLVNPASVTAIPIIDDYGKLRTCEYFPVTIIDFDENGDVIESPISLYNDFEYLKYIKYDGTVNNDDFTPYEIIRTEQCVGDIYDKILKKLHNEN